MTQFNLDTMKLWPTFGWPLSSSVTLTTTTSSPSLSVYSHAIGEFDPKLVLDFTRGTYKTGGNDSTLTDSITHSRGSLATMTHTDDVDLIGGFNQFTSATQYHWSNTDPVQSLGSTDISVLANGNLNMLAKATGQYGVTIKVDVEPLTRYTLEYGISKQPNNEYIRVGNYSNSSTVFHTNDNVNGNNRRSFMTHINDNAIWITFEGQNYSQYNGVQDLVFELNSLSLKKEPIVKWAPHNLLPLSNTFDSGWAKRPNTSIVANNAVAPNGIANTASTLGFSSTTSQLYKLTTVSFSAGDKVTLAAWVRSDNITSLTLSLNGRSQTPNNTLFANVAVTPTWSLVTYEATVQVDDNGLYFIFGWNAIHNVSTQIGDIEIYGAHMYRSDMDMANNPDTNDSYVPTTNSPVYLPRVGHYSHEKFSGWSNEGLLHESEARTNVVFPSADFSNSNWIKHNNIWVGTGSYNSSKNPDGVAYAQYVTDYSQVGYLELNTPNNLTSDHVRSIWARSESVGTVGLLTDYRNTGSEVTLTKEWQRFEIKVPSTDVNSGSFIAVDFRIGDLTRVYIWGAQAELGDYASSYIPTSSSQVTRAADVLTVPAANLPYSSTNMSIQMDGKISYADNGNDVMLTRWVRNATNYIQNRLRTNGSNEGQFNFRQRESTSDYDEISTSNSYFTPDINVPFSMATRHGATFINGAEGGTALTANITPTALPDLSSTDLLVGSLNYMGTIDKFRMWDEDLGDTGIEEASTPPPSDAFLMTVRVNAGETMVVPTHSSGSYDAEVDWGDGTVEHITDHNNYNNLHTYAVAGDYQVSIRGRFTRINFYGDYQHNKQHAYRVISVDNLGLTGIESLWYAFYECNNMVSFTSGSTDANIDDAYSAFTYCYALETIDLTGVKTGNCDRFDMMFKYCRNLVSLDVSGFDTAKATSFSTMFSNCQKLVSLDLSSWDTSSVTNMRNMFERCNALETLDVSSFDTSNISTFWQMFYNCESLVSLDLSSWDTSNVTSFDEMFRYCKNLVSLDLSNFDTSNVTTMEDMFSSCDNLVTVDLSNFDVSNVTTFEGMFNYCYSLESADLSSFVSTGNNVSLYGMFYVCVNLKTVDLSNFDTSNVTSMRFMFYYCPELTEVKGIENWNIQSLNGTSALQWVLYESEIDTVTYDQLLVNWEAQASSIPSQTPDFGDASFTQNSAAHTARSSLITNYGWSISDGGYA